MLTILDLFPSLAFSHPLFSSAGGIFSQPIVGTVLLRLHNSRCFTSSCRLSRMEIFCSAPCGHLAFGYKLFFHQCFRLAGTLKKENTLFLHCISMIFVICLRQSEMRFDFEAEAARLARVSRLFPCQVRYPNHYPSPSTPSPNPSQPGELTAPGTNLCCSIIKTESHKKLVAGLLKTSH